MKGVVEVFIYYDTKEEKSSVEVSRYTGRSFCAKEYQAGTASTRRIQDVMQRMTEKHQAQLVYLDMPAIAFQLEVQS